MLKHTQNIALLALWSVAAYVAMVLLHERSLLKTHLENQTLFFSQNHEQNTLEQSVQTMLTGYRKLEQTYQLQRNPLAQVWTQAENEQKYQDPLGIHYEYWYVELLEQGLSASEINKKMIQEIIHLPEQQAKKVNDLGIMGVLLLVMVLLWMIRKVVLSSKKRKIIESLKSVGRFGGAILGGWLFVWVFASLHWIVGVVMMFVGTTLFAFFGEKLGVIIFNLIRTLQKSEKPS